ncbi:MAG: trehalose synthase [Gaiellaceae bacterium]|jgi:trehalose synthase|nr:trehalose synthase [Gaiellaceae bacterium]
MLQLVNVGHKALADYATIATRGLMDEIKRLAEPLAGKRVVHLSATAFGGGVAEINYTLIPLMQSAGLEVEWRIIQGENEFFEVTKTIHNALQGNPQGLTAEQREIFVRYQELNARQFEDEYDFVVVHDPQPVGMIDYFPDSKAHWIWRGHIDFSTPNDEVFDFLLPSIRRYDAAIFHMRNYVPHAEGLPPCYIWPPAIDPLAPKNMALSPEDAAYIVDQFGIDVDRPLLTQVSRFDPWKDPLGVIDAYREVKAVHSDVQLALVGSMAHDDPEGWEFYNQTVAYAAGDPDIYILSNLNNVGSVEVNAFQVHSAAVLQKSIKEGFGLTVTEGLWKTRPTVAGRVGGIVTQIEDGVTGWLVDTSMECAEACKEILADQAAARQRALRGKEFVRRNFLTPRLLRDWLVLFNQRLGNDTAGAEVEMVGASA